MAYEKLMGRPHPSIRKHRLLKVDEQNQRSRTLRRSLSPPAPTNSISHEEDEDDEGSRYQFVYLKKKAKITLCIMFSE